MRKIKQGWIRRPLVLVAFVLALPFVLLARSLETLMALAAETWEDYFEDDWDGPR